MGDTRTSYWIDPTDTVRVGWVDDTPYVGVAPAGRAHTLTLFLGVADPQASLTDTAELSMRLIEALQGIHRELLQRAADPHAAGDGAKVPHRSIRTRGDLLTHLVADHAADPSDEALTEATDVALEARHRTDHGQPYGVDGYITQPDDADPFGVLGGQPASATPDDDQNDDDGPEAVEHDPGPEVDDEGGMSEYHAFPGLIFAGTVDSFLDELER